MGNIIFPLKKNILRFYLLVSQLLPQVGHHVPQLGGRDEAVAVLVKHPEGLPDLLLARKKCCVRIYVENH